MKRVGCALLLILCASGGWARSGLRATAQGPVYYVAADGNDTSVAGSQAYPWATITHALDMVPDGSTILVEPGTYTGRVRLRGSFAQGVIVRSQVPYRARLRNLADKVITSYDGCQGVTLEGFDIAHSGAGAAALVVHLDGGGEDSAYVSRVTLRDNILHDSYNNDILKINNGASSITVEGNVFYNQSGSDEHIDVNSVTDIVIQDNVFFNDFAGSGRTNNNDTSGYVIIKDSNGTDDFNLGSQRITLRRNVFLNWEGSNGYGFIQLGEDGTANLEAMDVLVENNLMLGNSANTMRSPVGVMGCRDISVRHNTVTGDLPSNAYAMRLYTYGSNQANQNIVFYNNIWADPSGTLDDFSDTPVGQTASFTLHRNLYWNGGQAIPFGSADLVNDTDDAARLAADPLLGSQAGLVVPRWDESAGRFADGSTSIRQVFERLVRLYGALGQNSLAIDAAEPAHAAAEDILGRPRPTGAAADIGAYEYWEASVRIYLPLIFKSAGVW